MKTKTDFSVNQQRRRLLKSAAALPLALAPLHQLAAAESSAAKTTPGTGIQRLNWAGLRFAHGERNLFIDPIVTDIWNGDSPYPLVDVQAGSGRNYALITHLHGDHFDVPGLKKLLGERGRVICEASMASAIASRGLSVIPMQTWKPAVRGPFTLVPLPANDGLGDGQVSWLIGFEGRKYLHAGDTMPHGHWRSWGQAYGPIDTAFLPINGAVQKADPPTEVPLSLTPAQAVDAAIQLGAGRLVPIHYGFHVEGSYEEFPDALATTRQESERRKVRLEVLKPGSWLPA